MLITQKYQKVHKRDNKERYKRNFSIHNWCLWIRPPNKKKRKETPNKKRRYRPTITIPH